MAKEKKQYNNIDLFKIIFAVVVVMIHTKPFMDISETANWYFSNTIANLAVPFFFVTSGFLLFGKLANCDSNNRDESVKKYIFHIIRMYLIWCAIWIPWKALHFYNTGAFTFIDFLNYIKAVLLVSGGDALWYLIALAFAASVVYLLKYKAKMTNTTILVISFVLYAIGYFISSWYGLFESFIFLDTYYSVFPSTDNGLFCGMMFVSIGLIIAESTKRKRAVKDVVLFVVFLIVLFAESYIINKSGLNRNGVCNNIILPVTVFFLFRTILNINLKGNEAFYRKLRDYSTLIYLSHCFIIRSIKLLLGVVGMNVPYILLFVVTLLLSLVFAVFVRFLAHKHKFFKLLY